VIVRVGVIPAKKKTRAHNSNLGPKSIVEQKNH
jgi:hypothetical protein